MPAPAELHNTWRAEQMIAAPRIKDNIVSIGKSRLPLALALPFIVAACGTGTAANTEPSKAPETSPKATPVVIAVGEIPSPTPSEITISPSPEATSEITPEPTESAVPGLSAEEVLDEILTQPDEKVETVSIKEIKTAMKNLWKEHEDSLSILEFSGPPVPFADFDRNDPDKKYKPSLEYMLDLAVRMDKGDAGMTGDELLDNRRQLSNEATVDFAVLYRDTDDPSLKKDIKLLMYKTYGYGSLVGGKSLLERLRKSNNWDIPAFYSWFK